MNILSLLFKKKAIKSVQVISASENLKYSNEIIYIEDRYYPEMNELIRSNYEKISEFFAK